MSNAIPSYEERLKNPGLEIINFSYIQMHPEVISEVWSKYYFDKIFREQVNNKIKIDVLFKRKFCSTFKNKIVNSDFFKLNEKNEIIKK